MKNTETMFVTCLVAGLSLVCYSQGTVEFANLHVGSPNAPVYESDGVTKVSGPQFVAELLGGASLNSLVSIATTGFLTDGGAGYYTGGAQAVPGVVPGATAWVEVRVWNTVSGSTFLQAQASGLPNSWWQSSAFSLVTGGGFQGPVPTPLVGLGNSPVYLNSVPEPSVLAFVGLGTVAIVLGYKNRPKADV